MLKGEVFKSQTFENHIFALFINLFMNKADGVARDYKNAMNITYSGHTVTVDSGACLVQGRLLEEDSSTTIDTGIETMFCKLVVEIDLDKINTSSVFNQGYYNIVKSASDYPALTQQDIVEQNAGKYQYELARFKVSEGVVTDFEDKRTYIEEQLQYGGIDTLTTIVNNNYTSLNNSKAPKRHTSQDMTYGVASTDWYGHAKVRNACDLSEHEQGVALSAYQGYVLKELIAAITANDTDWRNIQTTHAGLQNAPIYYKRHRGLVQIYAEITTSSSNRITTGATIGTLPSGFRPSRPVNAVCSIGSSGTFRLNINTSGVITIGYQDTYFPVSTSLKINAMFMT